jgi:hypothetical protein
MKPASNESQMEALLADLPPDISARLEKKLSSAPWTPQGVKQQQTLTIVYLAVILLIAFMGLTPQGRAFAQTIFKFFTTTDQTSVPLSKDELELLYAPEPTFALSLVDVTPIPSPPNSCSSPVDFQQCEVQKIEKQLSIEIKQFSTTPSGWSFTKVQSYTGSSSANTGSMIAISYEKSGGYLSLLQGVGDFPPDQHVLSSAVEQVKINEYYGEYVSGSFGLRNGDNSITWSAHGADQRIRWREGERWFEILALVGPGTTGYMDKQDLLRVASTMVYQPDYSQHTNQVNMNAIPNIPLAIKICGCNILQPTILPEGMTLENLNYDPQWKSITLNYGYRALRIVQTPVESALTQNLDGYKNVEDVQIRNVTGQYGISPAQKTIWESATPPVFTTNNSYSVLLWKKDGTVYQIYFDQSFSGGGQLTKDQMIEIGENLR